MNNLRSVKKTDSYDKIVKFIKDKKSVTKNDILEHMGGWGVRVKFSSYRNRLRNEKNIKLTKDRYEVINK